MGVADIVPCLIWSIVAYLPCYISQLCSGGEELPQSCQDEENQWRRFLHLACNHCRHSACEPSADLQGLAQKLVINAGAALETNILPSCSRGVLSALFVLFQMTGFKQWHTDLISQLGDLLGAETPPDELAPFPFSKEAWGWFYKGGFQPVAAIDTCSAGGHGGGDGDLSASSTKLVLDVQISQTYCPYNFHDNLLIRRCRQRSFSTAHFGAVSSTAQTFQWMCPELSSHNISGQKEASNKYDQRFCGRPSGSWGWDISQHLKCVFIAVGELLGFRAGKKLLDWGSGCGWFLTWAAVFYGTQGYGIDVSAVSTAWARRFSVGYFCTFGGLNLSWVPDQAFDYVTSFWSLYHLLSKLDQCMIIGQLVQKLQINGRMWLGGNCPDQKSLGFQATCFTKDDLRECLASWAQSVNWQEQGIVGDVETVDDLELFRATENRHENLRGDYLFWGGSYSAVITRVFAAKKHWQEDAVLGQKQ